MLLYVMCLYFSMTYLYVCVCAFVQRSKACLLFVAIIHKGHTNVTYVYIYVETGRV